MSITDIIKEGIFEKDDCPYSATAIQAVQNMPDFKSKSFDYKSNELWKTLYEKHPQMKWFVTCSTDGSCWWTKGSSVLLFTREGYYFEIVAAHDQNKIDAMTKEKQMQIDKLNEGKRKL
jgi:hypothetical protein